MAAQQAVKSALMAKVGNQLKAAHAAHANDETDMGNMELPPGIENGVAQLVDCDFRTIKSGKNKGNFAFYAAGIVKLPTHHDGASVEGQRTWIMEPLCATPESTARKTVDEHVAWIYNELRKLGVDTSAMSFDDIESVVEELRKMKPHFKFRTWKGKKQTTGPYANQEPRVNHQWGGVCDYNVAVDPASNFNAVPTNGTEVADNPISDNLNTNGHAVTEEPDTAHTDERLTAEQEAQIDPDTLDQGDLDSLAQRGDVAKDLKAMETLESMAIGIGYTKQQVDDANNWAEVVEMIRTAQQPTEEVKKSTKKEQEANTGSWIAVGKVCKYAPTINGKKSKKPIDVEITGFNKNMSVNLKDMSSKTTYTRVPQSDLIQNG